MKLPTRRSTFAAIAFLICAPLPLLLNAENTKVTSKPDFTYAFNISANNMVARLYINGTPLRLHASLEQMLESYDVTQFLGDGENIITVDYEPINTVERNYTPNDGVGIDMSLQQRQPTAPLGKIDIFSGEYDIEAQTLVATSVHRFDGLPLQTQAGTMTAPARYKITPIDMNYSDRISGDFARRLEMTIQVADPSLLTPPQEGAEVLHDTPEMREALFDAYSALHNAYSNRDVDAYKMMMFPALSRMSYVLGYGDIDVMLSEILKRSPLGGPAGTEMQPMPSLAEFQQAHLSWGSDRRMVWLSADPIQFQNPETGKAEVFKVVFCRQPGEPFLVCHQRSRVY